MTEAVARVEAILGKKQISHMWIPQELAIISGTFLISVNLKTFSEVEV